jgi:hypothetical protein
MFLPDPTKTKEAEGKKLVVLPFFLAQNLKFHKIENCFIFEQAKKKI